MLKLKKSEIFLFSGILIASAICFLILRLFAVPGVVVTVKQNNSVVYEGALTVDHTVRLDGNTVVIQNGSVIMKNADCKNQICVGHAPISQKGETILCLPNRVSVQIR